MLGDELAAAGRTPRAAARADTQPGAPRHVGDGPREFVLQTMPHLCLENGLALTDGASLPR